MRGKGLLATFLLGVGLCFVPVFQAMAQEAEIQGWNKFKWGMSPEEVKQVYSEYEAITGKKIWKEKVHTERFCVLETNDFPFRIGIPFSPEVSLFFFDNKLFLIEIYQEIPKRADETTRCALGHFAWQIRTLSTLADRLIKKYGTPVDVWGTPIWQGETKKLLDKIENTSPVDTTQDYTKLFIPLEGQTSFWLSWERENKLSFSVKYILSLGKKTPLLDSKCYIRFMIRYVNGPIQDEYMQEKQRVQDEVRIGFESF